MIDYTTACQEPAMEDSTSLVPNPPPFLSQLFGTLPPAYHAWAAAMYRRDMAVRDAALAQVDSIERQWGIWPTTAEHRRRSRGGT